ncbi:MAG TPA: hypothetical protein VGO42_11500 [Reyranella sp.]|nr:hypothetical protein [Reyranella sp.]
MSPFSALGRRGLIQGSTATVLGSVVMPAGSRAEAAVPQPIATNLVTASHRYWNGRDCLALELSTEEQEGRLNKTRSGNGPSFAIVHRDFTDGIIEAAIGAELTGKGAPDDRGFAGLSFHIGPDFATHETVYLRMTNGRLNVPPPPSPRIDRAIQYVAHPDFHFDVSRDAFPGRYEKGVDIAIGRWHRLRLEVRGTHLRGLVDGDEVLTVDDLHYAGRRGPVGLFVGDGSRGFFTDLGVLAA